MIIRTLFSTVLLSSTVVACTPSPAHDDDKHEDGDTHEDRDKHDDDARDKKGGDDAHDDVIRLDADAAARAGVVAAVVERQAIDGAVVPAEVQFEPSSTAHIAPLVSGRFTQVKASVGDRVKRGQVLAVVTSSDASAARSRFEQASARLAAATQTLTRQQQLSAEGIGVKRALIQAEAEVRELGAEIEGLRQQLEVVGSQAGSRSGELRLTSPIDGVVVQMHATLGEVTTGEAPAFVVTDPTRVWVRGHVPQRRVGEFVVGGAVVVRFFAVPELRLRGTVAWVAPGLDDTHTLPIRVSLEQPDARLRGGLSGTIASVDVEATAPIVVSEEAVATIRGRSVVFVPGKEKDSWVQRVVTTGRRRGGLVVIVSGLNDGDVIAGGGAFVLKSVLLVEERSAGHEH